MREYGVGSRTAKASLESLGPEPRKKPRPRGTRLDAYKPLTDQMLLADLDAPRTQRHTAKRIFDQLLYEHGQRRVPTRWCGPMSPTGAPGSLSRPAAGWYARSFRSPTGRGPTSRWTSVK